MNTNWMSQHALTAWNENGRGSVKIQTMCFSTLGTAIREIKEQIKGLQKVLNRKHSKRKGSRAKKRSE